MLLSTFPNTQYTLPLHLPAPPNEIIHSRNLSKAEMIKPSHACTLQSFHQRDAALFLGQKILFPFQSPFHRHHCNVHYCHMIRWEWSNYQRCQVSSSSCSTGLLASYKEEFPNKSSSHVWDDIQFFFISNGNCLLSSDPLA